MMHDINSNKNTTRASSSLQEFMRRRAEAGKTGEPTFTGYAPQVIQQSTPLGTAISYCRRGWNPIPIPFKTKNPAGRDAVGWQTRTITEATAAEHFNGAPQNVGIVMGPSSGGLTDLDLDCAEAIAIAPYVMPKTEAIFGRASKPDSHREYITKLAATLGKAVLKFTDPVHPDKKNNTLLEVRAGGESGAQTIFPGSVHESGEDIKWSVAGEPATVDDDELLRCAKLLAALSLMARYWPGEGDRHDAGLTVGGFLARCGYKPPAIKCFVEAIAKAAGDNQCSDRVKAAEDNAREHQEGRPSRGYPALQAMVVHEQVAKQIAELLDYRSSSNDVVAGDNSDISRLNKLHAVLPIGGKTRVVTFGEMPDFPGRETIVMTQGFGDFASLMNKYRHTYLDEKGQLKSVGLGSYWLQSQGRRQYDAGMAFMPQHDAPVVGDRLNLWRGYAVTAVKAAEGCKGCDKFLAFMRDIICSGNDADFDYLRKREALILQKRIRCEVALGLSTEAEGCGKGFYEHVLGRLLGYHYMQITNPKHIVGAFNPHLETLLRMTADEALFVGSHEHRNMLFTLITEPKLTIEPKGCGVYQADNFLNITILSNLKHFLQISGTARRFFIPTVSQARKGDHAYFQAIKDQLDNGGYEALLHYFLYEVDISDFNVRQVPRTEGLMAQRNQSLLPLDAWWCELLESGTLEGCDPDKPWRAVSNRYQREISIDLGNGSTAPRTVAQNGLYDQARNIEPRLRHHYNDHRLGQHLTEMGCKNEKKVLRRRGWTFPTLMKCRADWEERFPNWPWRDTQIKNWRAETSVAEVEQAEVDIHGTVFYE